LRNNIGHYLGMTGARLKGEDVFVAGIANFYIQSNKISAAKEKILKLFNTKEKVENPKEKIIEILNKYHSPSGKAKL